MPRKLAKNIKPRLPVAVRITLPKQHPDDSHGPVVFVSKRRMSKGRVRGKIGLPK